MTRHLLVHVGMPKCGSTYLQRALLQNRAALAAQGIAYPHDGQDHPGNGSGVEAADAARLEALFGGHDRLILSHEDLFGKGSVAQPLAQAAQDLGAQVHLLAFIRPLSEFVYGDYSQNMKQRFGEFLKARKAYGGRDFMTFAADRARVLDPALRLDQWRSTFEGATFSLHSHRDIHAVISAQYPDVALNWEVAPDLVNPSLRMADCEALARMINSRFVWRARIMARFKLALYQAGKGEDKGRTAARTTALEALFERQNAALLNRFGYDNRLTK